MEGWIRRGPPAKSTSATSSLPLKSREVSIIDTQALLRLIRRKEDKIRLQRALVYVNEVAPYEEAVANYNLRRQADPSIPKPPPVDRTSNMSHEDIEQLLRHDIIQPIEMSEIKGNGVMFTVDEPLKPEPCKRGIMWSDWINSILQNVPTPALEDVIRAALQACGGQWAVCFDLVSSFFQVAIADAVRPYYSFVVTETTPDGKQVKRGYAYKRLPMGTTFSPEVMQAIVQAMANIVQDTVFGSGSSKEVAPIVHIDNVRFLANTKREATIYRDQWNSLCEKVTVTCGTSDGLYEPHQAGNFLGLAYDYEAGTVVLAEKTLTKLKTMRDLLANRVHEFTMRDMARLFGICSFASRALRTQSAEFFSIYKFIRRRASTILLSSVPMWDAPANIWKTIVPEWIGWCDRLLKNEAVTHPDPDSQEHTYVLMTDSSTFGWGAILFDEVTGQVYQVQGKWEKTYRSHDINYLEMRAVSYALRHFDTELCTRPNDKILILVDNTSTRDVLHKGQAREYLFNGALSKVLKTLQGDRCTTVAYIPSADNLSDRLSRLGQKYSEQELTVLQSTLGALGGRLARSALPVRVPAALG